MHPVNIHGCEHSSIYLKHVNNCHYEVVVCGKTKDGNCASFCKSSFQDSLFDVTSNVSLKSCEDHSEKLHDSNSPEFKEEKKTKPKKRLHEDETYISIMRSITKKARKMNSIKENKKTVDKLKSNDSKDKSNDLHCEAVLDMEVDGLRQSLTDLKIQI